MKKKLLSSVLSVAMTASALAVPIHASDSETQTISYNYVYNSASGYTDDNTYTRQMEKLDRGLVAIKVNGGVYLSWRLFDSEDNVYGSADSNVSFNIYRNGTKITTVDSSTNYTDATAGSSYSVAPVIDGVEGEKCEAVSVMNSSYFDIPINTPASVTLGDGATYSYGANDASCGDLDGDGEYEIILKWDCNGKDNSQSGYTGNVLLDAYKLDGTHLWRIDLGPNIRAGAHYTQFIVYDLDGDGKAEIACKTAPGSKDSSGEYVSKASLTDSIKNLTDEQNETSYVDGGGFITTGPEYYTVFDGEGKAIDTIEYLYSRDSGTGFWGRTSNGSIDTTNRVDRFLGAVAYLDGVTPSVIAWRGYYDRTTAAAYTLENGRLRLSAKFDTDDIDQTYLGQGNHNITVADVDSDGKDEVITGALCLDDDFSIKWCSGRGHGDALHIGDYDPTNVGLEYFSVHESGGYTITSSTTSSQGQQADYGMTVYDANTGEELYHQGNSKDTGRGAMANIGSGGYYQISGSADIKAEGNGVFSGASAGPGSNFRIFWDGDLYDEILDGTTVSNWTGSRVSTAFTADGCTSVNGTKANPALQADLFGDWREELVYPTSNGSALRVFSTTTATEYKIKTLMHDPAYRSGVAAEQTAYNQPPHVGFYMGEEIFDPELESIEIISAPSKTVYSVGESLETDGLRLRANFVDGTYKEVNTFAVSGYDPNTAGEQTVIVTYLGKAAEFTVSVKAVASIKVTALPEKTEFSEGETLNTSGLVVTAYYEDGTSKTVTNYDISGYDPTVRGSQTVTVTYMGKTATFKVTVVPASIAAFNATYTNSSTTSTETEIPVGAYSGTFVLEHTVKINSLPANGDQDKNSTNGFLVKFMPQKTGDKNGVGAGWYITSSNGAANIYWKADSRRATVVTSSALSVGKEYTFKYTFTNVGTGDGASVDLTILDENGTQMGSATGLGLRNMTFSQNHTSLPLGYILLYNQANSGSESSVTISNSRIYGLSSITSVNGATVNVDLSTLSNTLLVAVKYGENNAVEQVEILKPQKTGTTLITASFSPDKVFLWTKDLMPIDMWTKSN